MKIEYAPVQGTITETKGATMRLIDADALRGSLMVFDSKVLDIIDNAPTIDAVQVVRCKECVYRPCKQMSYSYDHDYCSYGERNRDEID